ncbi:MAG: phenylacetate-CoA oxygenase/reductase subunit PaaK [Chitinophagales bacterium]|nr:phenylacetate-CoA oxygenase/reductase subunit PaaK [Chitinophagaceae bacterium]MCB9065344.1 phenylacetate-CoA oxygenase/reductase subunit PaaK [Chitinophagales bacterium]
MALKFHPLTVKDIRRETADCVSVALNIPEELVQDFKFVPGQYLTFRKGEGDEEIRRSYSICAGPLDKELRVAIKKVEQGKFSTYANEELKVGDTVEVMPPMGNFSRKKETSSHKHYLAIAAGSGITPIMSIMKEVLAENGENRFTLIYGNKGRMSIIFREEIEALKNKYMNRLRVFHVLSRESMDVPLFNGRITAEKCAEMCDKLIDITSVDEAFICGPEQMILSVREQLIQLGMDGHDVHMELFTSPDQPKESHEKWNKEHAADEGKMSKVSITLDGTTFEMDLAYNGDTILDAALKSGADLPFACKGGVCCTCRAKVTEGEVEMEVNYALEPDEVENGYVLTCQSHPKTDKVHIDFDQR